MSRKDKEGCRKNNKCRKAKRSVSVNSKRKVYGHIQNNIKNNHQLSRGLQFNKFILNYHKYHPFFQHYNHLALLSIVFSAMYFILPPLKKLSDVSRTNLKYC